MARDTAANFLTAALAATTLLYFHADKNHGSAFENLKNAIASASVGSAFRLACSRDMADLVEIILPANFTPFNSQNTLSWDDGIPFTLEEIGKTELNERYKKASRDLSIRFTALIDRINSLSPYQSPLLTLNTSGGSTLNTMRAARALQNTDGNITMYVKTASSGGTILAFSVQDPDRNLFLEPSAKLSYPLIMERISDILKKSTKLNMPLSDQDIENYWRGIDKYMSGSDGTDLPDELIEILEPYRELIQELSQPCKEMLTLNLNHVKYAYGLSTEDLVKIFGGVIILETNPDGSIRALVRKDSPFDLEFNPAAAATLQPQADLQ